MKISGENVQGKLSLGKTYFLFVSNLMQIRFAPRNPVGVQRAQTGSFGICLTTAFLTIHLEYTSHKPDFRFFRWEPHKLALLCLLSQRAAIKLRRTNSKLFFWKN